MRTAIMPKTCQHIKDDGTPCQANALKDSDLCFFHDPASEDKRQAARKAGGHERSKKASVLPPDTPNLPLKTSADVVELLAETINQVRRGDIDPRISNAVGYLAGITLKAMEQSDLDKRLEELETAVSNRPATPGVFFEDDDIRDAV
jgi:hypothetical protein